MESKDEGDPDVRMTGTYPHVSVVVGLRLTLCRLLADEKAAAVAHPTERFDGDRDIDKTDGRAHPADIDS